MACSVQIKLGDMFNGPTDLIIFPCSTGGSITHFVHERLRFYDIPMPKNRFELGEVQFMDFPGGESIAQYIGFAASVFYNSTTSQAIENIGKQIGDFTKKNLSVQVVSVPLLGAGAGGLDSETVVDCLKKGFQSTCSSDAKLIIYVLHQVVYNRIKRCFEGEKVSKPIKEDETKSHLRVFVSYTKTDDEHIKWVSDLVTFLRNNGVNTRVDYMHLKLGMDLPDFMANELQLADRVILVSNEQYAQKANGSTGGVGWETMLIKGDMLNNQKKALKYITIVKCENISDGLPFFLQGKYVLHIHKSANQNKIKQDLLKALLETDEEPEIGQAPLYI